jgi:hypothetical protein
MKTGTWGGVRWVGATWVGSGPSVSPVTGHVKVTVFTSTATGRGLLPSRGTRRGLDPVRSLGKRR